MIRYAIFLWIAFFILFAIRALFLRTMSHDERFFYQHHAIEPKRIMFVQVLIVIDGILATLGTCHLVIKMVGWV